jgi:hypothetical protein
MNIIASLARGVQSPVCSSQSLHIITTSAKPMSGGRAQTLMEFTGTLEVSPKP